MRQGIDSVIHNSIVEKAFSGSYPQILPGFLKGPSGKDTDAIKHPYANHPYVYAAVNTIARNIANTPFKFWKDSSISNTEARRNFSKDIYSLDFTKRKKYDFQEIKNGEWVSLFEEPNKMLTSFQLIQAIVTHYLLDGGAFIILRGKDRTSSIPTRLDISSPQGWTPLFNRNNQLNGWKYDYSVKKPDGSTEEKTETFRPYQVIWIYNYNPYDPIHGLATYSPAKLSVEQDHFSVLYNRSFFKNGAQLGTVFETDLELDEEQLELIKSRLEEEHVGTEKAHTPKILHSGLKVKNTASSHRDMEYRQLREWTRDEILAVFGVPKAMLGVIEDVNRATFSGAKRNFFETTLIPLMTYISEVFYVRMLKSVDSTIYGFFDLALVEGLRGDNREKAEVAQIYSSIGVPFNDISERFDIGFPKYNEEWATEGGKPIQQAPSKPGPTAGPDATPQSENPEMEAPTKAFIKLIENDIMSATAEKYVNLVSVKRDLTESECEVIKYTLDKSLNVLKGRILVATRGFDGVERDLVTQATIYEHVAPVINLLREINKAIFGKG